jgi:nicotinamide phosphoribosyltransferase
MMKDNVVLQMMYGCPQLIVEELTDAYKETHWKQYPKGTQYVYSYLESRGGKFDHTVFFGLQYLLKRYLIGRVVTNESIDEAIEMCEEVFGFKYFNEDGWRYIANDLGGRLPLEIKAVPEGTPVQVKNVLMTIVNTDPKAYFLPNFFEGLLELVWYPITVATISREVKKEIDGWAIKTGQDVSIVHLNDFGFRGGSSVESDAVGGMAHLVNFNGSDTLVARKFAKIYYGATLVPLPPLLSVYAAEHSTVTSYGEEHELDAYRSIIANAPDEAIISIVIDSYDAMRAVDEYFGRDLKEIVLERRGKVVMRPDSGDPKWMSVEVLESLWKNFGGTINEKGYKVLDPHVGVIYGDYISLEMIKEIMYEVVHKHRFAPSNIIFGMGGALLQKVNRDTQSFAFKCSAINIDGVWKDVYKRPISDARKVSKRGRLALTCDEGIYTTVREGCILKDGDVLQTVFLNGDVVKEYTFDQVKHNAALRK